MRLIKRSLFLEVRGVYPAAIVAACAISTAHAQNPADRRPGSVFPVPHVGSGIARLLDADRPVSGASPFGDACGVGSSGTLFRNSEVEPSFAVNPRDGRHWIASWQQDRWSDGGARGLVTAVTFDAGTTWSPVAMAYTTCAGGAYPRASDPWVDFAPDGTAYQIGIAFSDEDTLPGSTSAVLVSRSVDGGATWGAPVTLIRDTGAPFNDKETITADPGDARFAYAVWDRLERGSGPTYFSRTTDGGASWEPPRAIYDPGTRNQTIGNLIRVLPDGTLVDLLTHARSIGGAAGGATLEVIRSKDRGATWSSPVTVAAYQPLGVHDPTTGEPVRDGTPIAQMAVAPDGGLYVVWQDGRFTGFVDAIAIARSTDGGATWSTPARVSASGTAAAFAPQVTVDSTGTVAVTYYDLRSDTQDIRTLLADYWLARSNDGVNWSEAHLAGPFDLKSAPSAGGFFLGDYTGLAATGGLFLSLHARTTGNLLDPVNVYLARVPAPVPAAPYGPLETKATRVDPEFERRVAEALRESLDRRPAAIARRAAPP